MSAPTLDTIVDLTARAFGVTPRQIMAQNRRAGLSEARHTAMLLGVRLTTLTYSDIGRFMGRDRTTVRHSVEVIEAAIDGDAELAAKVAGLEQRIRVVASSRFEMEACPELKVDPLAAAMRALTCPDTEPETRAMAHAVMAAADPVDSPAIAALIVATGTFLAARDEPARDGALAGLIEAYDQVAAAFASDALYPRQTLACRSNPPTLGGRYAD